MIVKIMQQTVLFKAPGRSSNRPIVILTGPAIEAKFSTPITVCLSRALSAAWSSSLATLRSAKKWTRCNCTPVRIVRAAVGLTLSAPACTIAIATCSLAMLWHSATSADTDAARQAIALDCLCALPWGLAILARSVKEGGDK